MTYPDEPAAGPPPAASPPAAGPPDGWTAVPAVTAPEDAPPRAPGVPPLLPASAGLPPVLVTAPPADAQAGPPAPFPFPAPVPFPGPPPGAAQAGTGKPPRRRRRLLTVITLAVVGALLIAGGGVRLERELTRHATRAEAALALRREIASRWERLPAGAIFPATISYRSLYGSKSTARLVGISPAVPCAAAESAAELEALDIPGCTTILRATYVDSAGLIAATVGVGVLSQEPREKPAGYSQPLMTDSGLHTVAYPGTITAGFGDAQRAAAGVQIHQPYLFLYSAGYTDGQHITPESSQAQFADLGNGILAAVAGSLTRHTPACTMKDIKC